MPRGVRTAMQHVVGLSIYPSSYSSIRSDFRLSIDNDAAHPTPRIVFGVPIRGLDDLHLRPRLIRLPLIADRFFHP